MKKYSPEMIRNVSIIGDVGTGKTQLAEGMLYTAKAINRLGLVESGNTVCDYHSDEIDKQHSINLAVASFEFRDKKINILDTPGFDDFVGETIASLTVTESAILNVCSVSGIEGGSERKWKEAEVTGQPVCIFINRLDKDNANFDNTLEQINKNLSLQAVPVTVPVFEGSEFKGVIDLLKKKVYRDGKEADISAEQLESVSKHREKLIEGIASSDDKLIEQYLEGKELSQEQILTGLKHGFITKKILPVFAGSGLKCTGIESLLDFIADYAPSPLDIEKDRKIDPKSPMKALVFKTASEPHMGEIFYFKLFSGSLVPGKDVLNSDKKSTERMNQIFCSLGKNRIECQELNAGDIGSAVKLKSTGTNDTLCDPKNPGNLDKMLFPLPVMEKAVSPKSKGDEEKVATALSTMIKEDPTLTFSMNRETKEMILAGLGSVQLDTMVARCKERFGGEILLQQPKVAYRETVHASSEVQGKYKRQSGGRGQYGDCWIKLEPLERGKGYEFLNKIFGGAIPSQYVPAVEKGIKETMEKGVIAGYPVTDIKITLIDGSYHEVDSSNMAFEIAGSMALKKAMEQANPCLLEPIMKVEIECNEEYTGNVMGDLNSRRGKVLGIDPKGKTQIINAHIPRAEIHSYATDLRSITRGGGRFKSEFSHYEEVPYNIAQVLMDSYKKQREEGR